MEFNLNTDFQNIDSDNKAVSANESVVYECAVIGGGPAAVTAAVYLMRKGIKTVIITKSFGGQVAETKDIENYTGFNYIEGSELASKFADQVKQFEIAVAEGVTVESFNPGSETKEIYLDDGRIIKSLTVIICAGSSWRKLGVKGEDRLIGRGVAFCSTCDAPFFKDKTAVVAGGGNTGAEAALDLLKIAAHVTIVEIDEAIKADKVLWDKIQSYENFNVLTSFAVREIKGDQKVEAVVVEDLKTGSISELKTDGIFVEIGMLPNTSFLKSSLKLNDYGEIAIDSMCQTDIKGVFAAGDITSVPFKQIIIAAGEGAKAALAVSDYLMKS
jgi:alkyl hydroperoxide reductase subunit F